MQKEWIVEFCEEFENEFNGYPENVQDAIMAAAEVLQRDGPQLGQHHEEPIYNWSFADIKDLYLPTGDKIWEIFFYFDPNRMVILLTARGNLDAAENNLVHRITIANDRINLFLKKRKV
ncbi:type II toxin-antitoxin system RelE/ParE family toxin [Emcibacter nanhaiensis]|uniref:Addiction module toxin RelE n=1 Tax=Emcibacter nanhaiensis TaxID=1505037 RepID=A0A501PC57_9PROT|nr:type II toxin-antitoxin system RelE/ParE family toxin [Emcibacter nanhaiensis]TPD57602.1 addiction module toxin RelE [Emcibacter nanhaiensis]